MMRGYVDIRVITPADHHFVNSSTFINTWILFVLAVELSSKLEVIFNM